MNVLEENIAEFKTVFPKSWSLLWSPERTEKTSEEHKDQIHFKELSYVVSMNSAGHNTAGYSSLLLTFLSESPRIFTIFGLRRNSSAEPFRNKTIAKTISCKLKKPNGYK